MRVKRKCFKALLNVGPCTVDKVAEERYVTTQTESRNLDKLAKDDVIYKIRPPRMTGKYRAYDFFNEMFGQNNSKFWYIAKTKRQVREFIEELIDHIPKSCKKGKKVALTKCIEEMLPDKLEKLFWHRYRRLPFTNEEGKTLLEKATEDVGKLKKRIENRS